MSLLKEKYSPLLETNMEHLQVLRRLLGSRGENLNQSVTVL